MPIFVKRDKQENLSCNFSHIDGIQNYQKGIAVCATQEDSESRLSVSMRLSKVPPVYLPYSQIVAVEVVTQKDIAEKNKSVFGRAAVGGILLGPLGAIVGGMSGVGEKQKAVTQYYFVINYHPLNNLEDVKVMSFEIVGASLHWAEFVKSLRSKIPAKQEEASRYL